jgi:hypothetical protein
VNTPTRFGRFHRNIARDVRCRSQSASPLG